MNACATLGPIQPPAVASTPAPVVLIDGVPEARLRVESYSAPSPLDNREVRVHASLADTPQGTLERWLCSMATVAWPLRLTDDQVVWPVLLQGKLKDISRSISEIKQGYWLLVVDDWADRLARSIETIWKLNTNDQLLPGTAGFMLVGSKANRSQTRHDIQGQNAHVLAEASGIPWTVKDALETISAYWGVQISLKGLADNVSGAPILETIDLSEPIGHALNSVLKPYGLIIQRDMVLSGINIQEHIAIRPIATGRPIRLTWPREDQPIGNVQKTIADHPAQAAQKWIARAEAGSSSLLSNSCGAGTRHWKDKPTMSTACLPAVTFQCTPTCIAAGY